MLLCLAPQKHPQDWKKVMFSDESTLKFIRGTQNTVRMNWTVKHHGSVMIWGAINGARGRAGLSLLPENVTMNSEQYLLRGFPI